MPDCDCRRPPSYTSPAFVLNRGEGNIYALAFLGIKNVFHEFSGFPIRVGRLMSLLGNKNGIFHKHHFWNVTWAIGEDMIHSQVDQSFGAGPVGNSRVRIYDSGLTGDA